MIDLGTALPRVRRPPAAGEPYRVVAFPGEGIGPEVVAVAVAALEAAARAASIAIDVQTGGEIGLEAERRTGAPLTEEAARLCADAFAAGGAVLCGPGGGRFVYDLRRRFDLFVKLVPLCPLAPLAGCGAVKATAATGVSALVVRENAGGVYFGTGAESGEGAARRASHTFSYARHEVERLIAVALELARGRRRRLSVVVKPAGVPAVSRLWTDVLDDLRGRAPEVEVEVLEIDNAAFQLIHAARRFDVIAAPNLFGDILSDVGGLLLGSRGLCFAGSFAADGAAVYSTGHGAARDLAGRDLANPLGQVLAMAMMLRLSFGLEGAARLVERAVEVTLEAGVRTPDVALPGRAPVGTRELGERLVEAIEREAGASGRGRADGATASEGGTVGGADVHAPSPAPSRAGAPANRPR